MSSPTCSSVSTHWGTIAIEDVPPSSYQVTRLVQTTASLVAVPPSLAPRSDTDSESLPRRTPSSTREGHGGPSLEPHSSSAQDGMRMFVCASPGAPSDTCSDNPEVAMRSRTNLVEDFRSGETVEGFKLIDHPYDIDSSASGGASSPLSPLSLVPQFPSPPNIIPRPLRRLSRQNARRASSYQYQRAAVAEPDIEEDAPRQPSLPESKGPIYRDLVVHAVLCAVIYPLLFLCVVIARGNTIFWARFAVATGCTVLGGAVGSNFLRMGRRWIESAGAYILIGGGKAADFRILAWATLIHQTRTTGHPGLKLTDFAAYTRNPISVLTGMRLLWDRFGTERKARAAYE